MELVHNTRQTEAEPGSVGKVSQSVPHELGRVHSMSFLCSNFSLSRAPSRAASLGLAQHEHSMIDTSTTKANDFTSVTLIPDTCHWFHNDLL
jgi:hypothetical protein